MVSPKFVRGSNGCASYRFTTGFTKVEEAGVAAVALQAGSTLIFDKARFVEAADALKLAIAAFEGPDGPEAAK